MRAVKNIGILERLQADILRLEGFRRPGSRGVNAGLGPLVEAFPDRSFPLGAVHEFCSERLEEKAATRGFVSAVLSQLMGKKGTVLWVSPVRTVFPPALKSFGVDPDRIIFADPGKEQHVLWTLEEALKCRALSAVVGEVSDLSFIASRRLQLAAEESRVTAFVIRSKKQVTTTACVSRWRITPLPSEAIDGLPGIGFPQWRMELIKVRNGRPGIWDVRWVNGKLEAVQDDNVVQLEKWQKRAG